MKTVHNISIYVYNFTIFTPSKIKNTEDQENLMKKIYSQSFLPIKKTLTCTKTIINRFLP